MIFDLAVLAVLLISAGIAFFRGFIREVLTILGVVGGLVAAYFGGPLLAPVVHGWFDTGTEEEPKTLLDVIPYDMVADAVAYGIIFLVVVIVLSVASHFLSGWAKSIGLGAVDRTLGVLFGIARGVIILALLYLPVSIVVEREKMNERFKDSKTHFYVAETADWLMGFVPDSFKEDASEKADEAAESMQKATRERLQELDVLGGGKDDSANDGTAPPDDDGYQRGERQDLNDLIRKNFNE